MPGRERVFLVLAALCAVASVSPLAGQEPGAPVAEAAAGELDPTRAVAVSIVEEGQADGMAARFAEALADALLREAQAAGYDATRESAPGAAAATASEPEAARRVAAASGARWIMIASARLEGSRILWRASVYDGESGGLMGADSFSAYAGLSALSLMDSSAGNAMDAAILSIAQESAPAPVDRRLRFASRDEGALASIGGRPVGEVSGGELEVQYYPFAVGSIVAITVEKEGYWPRTQAVKVRVEDAPLRLKPLFRETRAAFGGSYGTGRLLGVAGSYRSYPLPDRVYLRAEASVWAAYDFSADSAPVLHDEIRLGAAAYPLFDPDSHFRASVGTGFSIIGSLLTASNAKPRLGMDICIEPVFYTLEWHEPGWAIVFEARYPYSMGLSSGFLRAGWLNLGDSGPQFYSLGILFKR